MLFLNILALDYYYLLDTVFKMNFSETRFTGCSRDSNSQFSSMVFPTTFQWTFYYTSRKNVKEMEILGKKLGFTFDFSF